MPLAMRRSDVVGLAPPFLEGYPMSLRSIPFLSLLAMSSAASAAIPVESVADQATVSFEIIDTKGRDTLLTTAVIAVPVAQGPTADLIGSATTDFSKPVEGFADVRVVRQRTYVAQSTKQTNTTQAPDKPGTTVRTVVITKTPGVVEEGVYVRAQVFKADASNDALRGQMIVQIRQPLSLRSFVAGDQVIELPQVSQDTFTIPLNEGESKRRLGRYQINTVVKRAEKRG